jgi:hypothetical protein
MNGLNILDFTPGEILGVLQSMAILAGGIWVLVTFRSNNRIKSIETLIALEAEYRRHIPMLLDIECDYAEKVKPLLVEEKNDTLSTESRTTLNRLDEALRHFVICAQIRNLGVDRGLLDITYQYYLGMLYSNTRPELKAYIDKYWPIIQGWASALHNPPRPVWKRLFSLGS